MQLYGRVSVLQFDGKRLPYADNLVNLLVAEDESSVEPEEMMRTLVPDSHQVVAMSVKDGNRIWAFTAGGLVDTPPTIDRGRAFFGCADGWLYCVRMSDGQLVWRLRGAPRERLVGAITMRQRQIFPKTETAGGSDARPAGADAFLRTTCGMLDDEWFSRARWYLGDRPVAEYLVFDDDTVASNRETPDRRRERLQAWPGGCGA